MKRTMRKTIAAILASVTFISTISAGSTAMAVEDNEPEANVEVVTEYENGRMDRYDKTYGVFISGNSGGHNAAATKDAYYLDMDADAKLILVDKKGNVSEIQNKNDDGSSKYNRIVVSGGIYWLRLYKDEKMTAVDMEGNYLGGNPTYYDIDEVIAYDSGNGVTVTEKTDDSGNSFFEYQLILESGKVIPLASTTERWGWGLSKERNLILLECGGKFCIYDCEGNEIDSGSYSYPNYITMYSFGNKVIVDYYGKYGIYDDVNGYIKKDGYFEDMTDTYIAILLNNETKVYDTEFNEVMRLNEKQVNMSRLAEAGYMTVFWGGKDIREDIVGLDGVYWYGSDDMQNVRVINEEKAYFMGSIISGEDTGMHILSKDKTININVDKKITEALGNMIDDYSIMTSSYYNIDGNVYVRVREADSEKDTADKVYVFNEDDNYDNPVEVNQLPVKVGNSYTKKSENGICNIYNKDNKLIYSAAGDVLKAVYTTSYKDYNLLLAVNNDDSFSVVDWNGTVQYQSKDNTFVRNTVDESGNMLIETKIGSEDGRFRLLKAYTLFNKNDNADNEDNNKQKPDKPYIYVLPADNPVITAEEFEKLLEENKNRDVVIDNGNGVTFTFEKGTMERIDGKAKYDFGAIIITEYGKIDVTVPKWVEQDNFAALIHYRYSGKLPAKCSIRFNIGEEWAGKALYYSYLKDGEVSETKEIKVDSRGYVTVTQTHCSDYILTAENPMEKNKIPPTWDSANVSTYIIMIMSMIGMVMLVTYKRKSKA